MISKKRIPIKITPCPITEAVLEIRFDSKYPYVAKRGVKIPLQEQVRMAQEAKGNALVNAAEAPMPPTKPLPQIPQTRVKPVVTGALTELKTDRPLSVEPTSFSSTVGTMGQSADLPEEHIVETLPMPAQMKKQNVSLGATELGGGKLTQQIVGGNQPLSYQSILDGALGAPYTSKANAINKTNYADRFVRDINGVVSVTGQSESKKIDRIKRIIDAAYTHVS